MNWIFGSKAADDKAKEARQHTITTESAARPVFQGTISDGGSPTVAQATPQPTKDQALLLWHASQMELRHTGKNLCDKCDDNQMKLWHANYMELWRTHPDLWNELPANFRLNFVPY